MFIDRRTYKTMRFENTFNRKLVRQYNAHMVSLGNQNGKLQAELIVANNEIAALRAELARLTAEKEVSA